MLLPGTRHGGKGLCRGVSRRRSPSCFFLSGSLTNAANCRVRKNFSQGIKDSLLQNLPLILTWMLTTHCFFPSLLRWQHPQQIGQALCESSMALPGTHHSLLPCQQRLVSPPGKGSMAPRGVHGGHVHSAWVVAEFTPNTSVQLAVAMLEEECTGTAGQPLPTTVGSDCRTTLWHQQMSTLPE